MCFNIRALLYGTMWGIFTAITYYFVLSTIRNRTFIPEEDRSNTVKDNSDYFIPIE